MRPCRRLVFLLLVGTALAGCGDAEPGAQEADAAKESAAAKNVEIRLEIVEGKSGSVLALIPIFINGRGPFPFALDTGASESVVDREVVEDLDIAKRGRTRAQGVGGAASAREIVVRDWRADKTKLAEQRIVTVDLPEDRYGDGLRGLLGSDMLNNYDLVSIDYQKELLILRPRAKR